MKTFSLTILLFVTQVTFLAQEVPLSIKNIFNIKYEEATKIEWSLNELDYDVNFYHRGQNKTAKFDEEGNWLETKIKQIKESQLPLKVSVILKSKYPESEIKNIIEFQYNIKTVVYEMIIYQDDLLYFLRIKNDGEILFSETYDNEEEIDLEEDNEFRRP